MEYAKEITKKINAKIKIFQKKNVWLLRIKLEIDPENICRKNEIRTKY